MIVNFEMADDETILDLGLEDDPLLSIAEGFLESGEKLKNGLKTIKNFYETYSKNFLKIETLKKEDLKILFRASSYIKFLFFWYEYNDSEVLMPKLESMYFENFFINQLTKKEVVSKKILQLKSSMLEDWQLKILENIKIYTIKNKN